MKTITAKEFRQATDLDPNWATGLTEPVTVTECCDMRGSKIARLSKFLIFNGFDPIDGLVADFSDCNDLLLGEGQFRGKRTSNITLCWLKPTETSEELHNALKHACRLSQHKTAEILLGEKNAWLKEEVVAIWHTQEMERRIEETWQMVIKKNDRTMADIFLKTGKEIPYVVMETCIRTGNLKMFQKLLDHWNASWDSPLLDAAGIGNIEMMKLLIEKGADINFRGLPLRMAAGHNRADAVRFLLNQGADLELALTLDPKQELLNRIKVREALKQGQTPMEL